MKKKPLAQWCLWASLFAMGSTAVYAQDQDTDTDTDNENAEKKVQVEEIVVTGSRLSRDTFSSISPLQIITANESASVGLIDPASVLQGSTAASGQQIDLTFGGYVLDNGPGSQTVSLRNLGSARTLVLVNGRRLAPAGVEGAPYAADLGLIPSLLVQQYDLLLDGASSIYGSDAVAGVVNVQTRKDFDGFEMNYYGSTNADGEAGDDHTLALAWGTNTDRGFFGFGLEYSKTDPITRDDRPWTAGCETHVEVDENGNIRTEDLWYSVNYGMASAGCAVGSLAGRVSVPFSGSIYYTPGYTNGGWANFSESNLFSIGVDGDGNGVTDVNFRNHDINGREQFAHIIPDQESLAAMAYGEHTFEGEGNTTGYFEVTYNRRETFIDSGAFQLFPSVPGSNPYNICNPNGLNGVDCGLAYDALLTNPSFAAQVAAAYGGTPAQFGLLRGPIGAAAVTPIVSVRGDRTQNNVEVDQVRAVIGVKGDLVGLDFLDLEDWKYDYSFSYTQSKGTSARKGVRGDLLSYSLATSRIDPATGNVICGDNDGCVPINMFAASLYDGVVGDFATQAERDYVFDSRDFDTEYSQWVLSAYMNGPIANTDAGPISLGFGVDMRVDDINSMPDDVARDGLFFGFFSDGGAVGDKWTREVYGEIEVPILAGKPMAEELTVNLSTRWTEDQYFGDDTTYSAKVAWRPVDFLLFRATKGSSYRAPNMRENFLLSQTGFGNVFDPCGIPDAALDPLSGGYNQALDTREAHVIQNCINNGVDPRALDFGGFNSYSVEIANGGVTNLKPETSEATSWGFTLEQPWFESFDMSLAVTHYEIDIRNAILEPTAQYLVNDCYGNTNLNSTFCGQVLRDPADGRLDLVNAFFINRDQELVEGVDVNLRLSKEAITLFGSDPFNVEFTAVGNRTLESSVTFLDDDGNAAYDDDVGEFGIPEWSAQTTFRIVKDKYTFTWRTNFLGAVEQDPTGIDAFDDITGSSDTCLGPSGGDVLCRDVGYASAYRTHTASLRYDDDQWGVTFGARNVFDEKPPQVDGSEVLSINNTPIGYGYDIYGRTLFLDVDYRF